MIDKDHDAKTTRDKVRWVLTHLSPYLQRLMTVCIHFEQGIITTKNTLNLSLRIMQLSRIFLTLLPFLTLALAVPLDDVKLTGRC